MADLIQFANFAQLSQMITAAGGQVAGMSAAEAAAALGATENSGLFLYNAAQAASGASNIINFPNAANAAEAFNEFLAAEGSVSGIGAAVGATGAAKATANMVVGQSLIGQAATTVYGLLSVSLPAAASALAPLAGFALGAGLYESNPEFWTRISQTLLPFCYNDSQSIPVLVDSDGNTYFDQRLIDAFKQFAQSEGIGGPSGHSSDLTTGLQMPISTTPANTVFGTNINGWVYNASFDVPTVFYTTDNSYSVRRLCALLVSSVPNITAHYNYNNGAGIVNTTTLTRTFTYDGKTVYYAAYLETIGSNGTILIPITNRVIGSLDNGKIAWTAIYGTPAGGYPEGTEEWEGNAYPAQPQPVNAYSGLDQAQEPIFYPYYPVALPVGDPWATSDPVLNPDPALNPDPDPVITPWINPTPNPNQYPETYPTPIPDTPSVPNPVPSPQPVPDPSEDPSHVPDPGTDPGSVPDNPEGPAAPRDEGGSIPPVVPVIPTLPSAASSLLHVYNPNQSQLDAFGSWLWTTFSGDLIETLSKLFNNPMDAVIGLHELYATPSTQGAATIRAGFLDSEVPALLVGERYTTINCGTVIVTEYWQNYLDYAPYTEVYIYLPFIGIVRVNANDIIGNAVNIKYSIDAYTGCCIAIITVARDNYQSTVYQFEGNCAVEIPITSGYQSALMSGLLAVASTAIGGNPVTGMLMAGRGRGVNQVQHSGSFGSSYGAMGAKIPYIIIKRPTQKVVENYSISYGYPAHTMVFVGNCVGYIRALEVIATSSKATKDEIDLIISLLKEGVYVT